MCSQTSSPPANIPDGLEEHRRDAQRLQHLEALLVVAEQAVIEADDDAELAGGGKAAPPQIGEGEETGSPPLQEGQFRPQLLRGDRRHPEAIQEGKPARTIHPVVEQAHHLAPQAPAPEAIQRRQEQQIRRPVGQAPQPAQDSTPRTTRTAASLAGRSAR